MTDRSALLAPLRSLVRRAGAAILAVYGGEFAVRAKPDASPVTEADLAAERIIAQGLRELTPDIPVIAEEAVTGGTAPGPGTRFWLVDPLDGTKEFVKRNGEFTVNVGLIEDGRPTLGAIYAPVADLLFSAHASAAFVEEKGQAPRPIRCRKPPAAGLVVLTSRSHRSPEQFDAFIKRFRVAELRASGSSIKFALVAAGEADLYPRFGRTMEWDTAAGHAILNAAGGCLTLADGSPLAYGKPGFENPPVVAWGAPAPFGG